MHDGPVIREMTVADCPGVAEVRTAGWRHAYRGLMPQAYLDRMDPVAAAERHRELLEGAGPGVVNLVAEREGRVVGWACLGPHRGDEAGWELYTLYVDPVHHRAGLGGALLLGCLPAEGDTYLWVVRDNTPARLFYERHGFAPDGAEEPFTVDGVDVPEVRYVRPAPSAGPPAPAPAASAASSPPSA
ncbi:GNAT family N-acetyltransferase [Streptomyces sp. NPDC005012]|uniref:GNAT family N-acetyltransferase n=1 Tax=unclassified Streptomyces TaxID=2593676 RepID=UPI0033BB754C